MTDDQLKHDSIDDTGFHLLLEISITVLCGIFLDVCGSILGLCAQDPNGDHSDRKLSEDYGKSYLENRYLIIYTCSINVAVS